MMFWAAVLCSSLSLVGVSAQDESSLLNKSMFLPTFSPAKGFHTREALTEVGRSSRASGTSGDSDTTHKRELAASDSAQTSDQTTVVLCSSLCLIVVGIPAPDVGSLVSKSLFDLMLKHRNDADCPAKGFYTYEAFMEAANSFGAFGTTADTDTRKREIAAFLAQTSQETTGGWATAPDGPYAWGYCYNPEQRAGVEYCVRTQRWPCAAGKNYRGRGPFQLAYNYNYGQAGEAIGADLINNPELVTTDAVISFKTAIWFWMTPQSPKPSCHDAMTGRWRPSKADSSAGRVPGYGLVTNLINGGIECGGGNDTRMLDRIGFYKRYCDILGVSYGNNLDCAKQRPFGA